MQCSSCKIEITDESMKFCPECGYIFDEKNKLIAEVNKIADRFLEIENLSFQESISEKPLTTYIADKDEKLFLVKQVDEKYVKIYKALAEQAKDYLPSLDKEGEGYYLFNWDGMWEKLSDWTNIQTPIDVRLKVWYKIARFVEVCHENGIIINNFNPDCIWINEDNHPVFECLEFFSFKGENNIVVFNEGFSSPEVKGGIWDSVGCESDIFGMGRLFIYLYKAYTKKEMVDLKEIAPIISMLPLNFGFAIFKSLSEDIDSRWKNLGEFICRARRASIPNMSIFGVSETGFREINEDSIYYSQKRVQTLELGHNVSLMIVADGMGGLDCGEVASNFAVKELSETLEIRITEYLKASTENSLQDEVINIIKGSIEGCNIKLIKEKERLGKELGTTIVACIVIDNLMYMGYVGDSRLYIFADNGKIKYVTEDHSLVGKREAEGDLTEEEAMLDSGKNLIYQALGLKKTIRVDSKSMELNCGDIILLCSDGICGSFLRRDLEEILSNLESPKDTAVKLCYGAFERGSTDNCSLILAQLEKEGDCNENKIFNA